MSRPRLLVLAGGRYQLPLIDAARRRGLEVVLFDGSPDAPGFRVADVGRVVDISDADAVIAAAREVRPVGVASIVSEVSVRTGAAAAAALGLPGIGVETAACCTDKVLMRERFVQSGLRCPRFVGASSVSDARAQIDRVGLPAVVKPVDSAGSRGVRRVDRFDELDRAVDLALAHSKQKRAIVEAFLEGPEATVETFTVGGRTEILGISDKVHLPFPYCVSMSLTYPPYFDDKVRDGVAEAARRAVDAVGLSDGAGHIEVLVTPDGPVVVEIAARGGGYRIFSDILPGISGVDPVEAILDVALGRSPDVRPTKARAAVLRFFNPLGTGVLRSVTGVEAARAVPGVHDVVIEAEVGQLFRGITRDGERPGYVIAIADGRHDALSAADAAEALVTFEIDTGAEESQRA